MNFQFTPGLPALKVLMINSLSSAGHLVLTKLLGGSIFGIDQLIDLILLVYSNEKEAAQDLKLQLKCCAYSCMNSIEISSDLPSYKDADVFLFLSNFKNPNSLDFDNIDTETFDQLYLIMKIANGLEVQEATPVPEEPLRRKNNWKETPKPRKKLIWADGLVALDIVKTTSRNLPYDVFYCATPLHGMAKTILAEYLKTTCSAINHVYVWSANDLVFHIEVEKPYVLHDDVTSSEDNHCDWDMIGKDMLESLNLDHTQFNESWMKKDYIEKILAASKNNHYGNIGRAAVFTIGLRHVWKARTDPDGAKFYRSLGVICDGSLGTLKDHPCVLPVILSGDNWSANTSYEETYHLRQEIKRINKVVKEHHEKLARYCKKFIQENIIQQEFVPDDSSISYYSLAAHSQLSQDNSIK